VTHRIVADTNVIASGLGWSGPPSAIIDAAVNGRLVLITSRALLGEMRRVLAYPKLASVIGDSVGLADLVEAISVVVEPRHAVSVVSDEADNRLLEAAAEGEADYVISGDKDLLALGTFEGIPILPPAEFVSEVLRREGPAGA
jgi:putative PIN family toxin of toxin-antitoxin system